MSTRNGEANPSRKDRGAYYTTRATAAALCAWALRSGREIVLDPSAGDGSFLAAAATRLNALGGSPDQVKGVELDPDAHARARARGKDVGIPLRNIVHTDFFSLDPGPTFDAVIGNPPFIRFQRFKGSARERARVRAEAAGVALSPLASSWAPFVVHGATTLRAGGRMALLVPHEIGQARYSRAVLAFLADTFRRVTLVAPETRLFPDIDQDVLVLLADGHGQAGRDLRFTTAENLRDLEGAVTRATPIDLTALIAGTRLRYWELPATASRAYQTVADHPDMAALADLAEVSSGYVTGSNAYFHLLPADVERLGLEATDLVPAVFRAAALRGPTFADADWNAATSAGAAGYLFQPAEPTGQAARAYLERGLEDGVHLAYKTRTRAVWHRVPRVRRPDLLLAAMAADRHVLAVNGALAAPANTLHAVDLLAPPSGDGREPRVRALALTLAWQTSAAWLAREIEGRVLGGGMLKLEPGEAGRLLVPWPASWSTGDVAAAARRIERILHEHGPDAARREADTLILREHLGLTHEVIETLAEAAAALRERRRRRPVR